MDSWYWQGLMVLIRTYGIDKDLRYRQGLMVLTTHMVLTETHGRESVLLNHTCMRGPSVTRMRQSCYQIEISPEFGSFSGAFLGTFDKNKKVLWYLKKKWELFGSFFGCFWQICRNSVLFRELFQCFGIIWMLFGAFLTNFEIAQNFLCYFLKNSEFGRTPEFREQVTALLHMATSVCKATSQLVEQRSAV